MIERTHKPILYAIEIILYIIDWRMKDEGCKNTDSGKSKGTLFVSANTAILNKIKNRLLFIRIKDKIK